MSAEAPRLLSFTPRGFTSFLNLLRSTYGTAGDAMIYSMSEKYGVELIRLYMPILPDDVEARIAGMRILAELFGQRGWGKLTFEEMDIEGGTISALIESHPARDRIEDCMGPKEAPLCIFLRGAIAGLLSSVLEKDLSVRAVDCSLKDQNICRYIFDVS